MTGRALRCACAAAALAAAGGLAVTLSGCGSPAAPAHHSAASWQHYGGYASYLPRKTLHYSSDAILTGTTAYPALTNQGQAVRVKDGRWSALITVAGPQVPGEGLPVVASATTCTWVITVSQVTGGDVPVSPADFTSINADNDVYRPAFVKGQPAPPKTVAPGQTVRFELRVVENTGEGLMRWAPDGRNIVAKWDFVVEND